MKPVDSANHRAETVPPIQFYIQLFSLYRVAEAFPHAFMNSWQTSLLILRNNPQRGYSMGRLNFSPFTGHGNCFLALTVAILREAACGLVEKGQDRLQGRAGTFNTLVPRISSWKLFRGNWLSCQVTFLDLRMKNGTARHISLASQSAQRFGN